MPTPQSSVDKAWFEDQIKANKTSARQLAAKIGIDASAMSLIFSGKRKMSNEEAAAIALNLNVPLQDVLAHAGVDLRGVARPTISIPTPSGKVVRVEIPPGLTPKEWELAANFMSQYLANSKE